MSGHSKWANIKHRKSAQDAKRGQLFSKLAKEITVAAKIGGGNPDNNVRLRVAIERAREANMPTDNIERAIKRGTGELEGVTYEEVLYEGYGPGGVAILVSVLTDNKNRTAAEMRKIFSKFGGSLGSSGSVSWIFEKKGYISVDASKYSEDQILEISLESGAEDVKKEGDVISIYTPVEEFSNVLKALKDRGIEIKVSEISMIPKTTASVDDETAIKVLKLLEEIENNDDVQSVSSNLDASDSAFEKFSKEAA
ncbi:MAG: YebC/PmpR family DNA-binding transcriptional regulator [Spirochaetia bacterium]|nr:YebC/PmpR family DNA-binding transcriptional regulator [Spirochaetota bacterium]MCX8097223.1 YebC/PmpR family DNA-binding transcriptional regulator [Spirochaetota bacterium]MDW8111977.1 YebC/PmpR family DNA-binding transcriptional regulator [Spirochaetia bacterium]